MADGEPKFTPAAQHFWSSVNPTFRVRVLNNACCVTCRSNTSIELLSGCVERRNLILEGRCVRCGGEAARVIEGM